MNNKEGIATALACAFLGFIVGVKLQYEVGKSNLKDKENETHLRLQDARPYGVTSWDLNGDGKEDIVVYSQTETNIFIQRRVGGYTPFEKYQKDARDNLEVDVRRLEDSFSNIQNKAGEIRALGAGR